MAGTAITYDSFDMNSSTVITSDPMIDAQSFDRTLSTFNLARTGGAVITDSTYYTKTITLNGKIVGTSQTNLESLIDTFQDAFAVQDKNLDIAYNSTTRRYVATPAKVDIRREVRGANWASFQIDFLATEYGQDTSTTTLMNAVSKTTTPASTSLTIGGTAPEQFLRIQITLTKISLEINKVESVHVTESKSLTRI